MGGPKPVVSSVITLPGTQMTIVLIGKGLVLEASTTKIEDKQVPGIYRGPMGPPDHGHLFLGCMTSELSARDPLWYVFCCQLRRLQIHETGEAEVEAMGLFFFLFGLMAGQPIPVPNVPCSANKGILNKPWS